ncbi:hypothetical protein RJ639_034344 [Escallonia herrerae]|uniref:Uncharacterized protein n=1 Tax=Escallonia herrerae TaxID=1293975 RepID=A0AA89B9E0_9ASTE|nr:hypothetical protein RJ639_034344 [Escallonia herrerae]
MARSLVPLDEMSVTVGGWGGLLLLCMVILSVSIVSMILFACADDPKRRPYIGGGGCGDGGGGGCDGGGGGGCDGGGGGGGDGRFIRCWE